MSARTPLSEQEIVAEVLASLDIQEAYASWILALAKGANREAPSCCGNACRPCTLTVDRAVALIRARLGLCSSPS